MREQGSLEQQKQLKGVMDALPDMVMIGKQQVSSESEYKMHEVYANRRAKEFFGGQKSSADTAQISDNMKDLLKSKPGKKVGKCLMDQKIFRELNALNADNPDGQE